MTIIHRLKSPPTMMLHFMNCTIKEKSIFAETSDTSLELPTMYKSWTSPQKAHLKIRRSLSSHEKSSFENCDDLLIFDTWGTSSYYHLLIDHIIPVWITRNWGRDQIGIFQNETRFWRISNNGWQKELPNAQEIFTYFLGSGFEEKVEGNFKNALYGYCFSWRPFTGSDTGINDNYKVALDKFRSAFCPLNKKWNPVTNNCYVLVPTRNDREFPFVMQFVSKYSALINFLVVDMGRLKINEQIELAAGASAIFGSEGAAFANSIFMKKGTLVMPFSSEPERFLWHQTISRYVEHEFYPVLLDNSGAPLILETVILNKLKELPRNTF